MTQKLRVALMLSLGALLLSPAVAEEPPLPAIPGITAADPFPDGCIDCHIERPQDGMDVRISTKMNRWYERVDPKVLERVRGVTAGTMDLSGKHPLLATQSYEDIPASCTECHARAQEGLLSIGPILHTLHLTGGRENHFLTLFGGECTHCHKFDADTGVWSIPSGSEK